MAPERDRKGKRQRGENCVAGFVLLVVCAVNVHREGIVSAVITRRETDYRLSARTVRPAAGANTYQHGCKKNETQRWEAKSNFHVFVCRVFPYRPAEAQAGLCGCQQGEVGRAFVGGGLQGLNGPRGGAHGAGSDDVHLAHPEPGQSGENRDTDTRD